MMQITEPAVNHEAVAESGMNITVVVEPQPMTEQSQTLPIVSPMQDTQESTQDTQDSSNDYISHEEHFSPKAEEPVSLQLEESMEEESVQEHTSPLSEEDDEDESDTDLALPPAAYHLVQSPHLKKKIEKKLKIASKNNEKFNVKKGKVKCRRLLFDAPTLTEPGSLIWAKWRQFPWWPAVVKSFKKRKKRLMIRFIQVATVDDKTLYNIALGNVNEFSDTKHYNMMREKCLETELPKIYTELRECIEKVDDFLRKKALRKISDANQFFFEFKGRLPIEIVAAESAMTTPSEELIEVEEDTAASKDQTIFTDSQRQLPHRNALIHTPQRKKIFSFMKSPAVRRRLVDIYRNRIPSKRHVIFTRSQTARDTLKFRVGFGGMSEEQVEEIVKLLNKIYTKDLLKNVPCKPLDRQSYVLNVMWPEALLYAYRVCLFLGPRAAELKLRFGNRTRNPFIPLDGFSPNQQQ